MIYTCSKGHSFASKRSAKARCPICQEEIDNEEGSEQNDQGNNKESESVQAETGGENPNQEGDDKGSTQETDDKKEGLEQPVNAGKNGNRPSRKGQRQIVKVKPLPKAASVTKIPGKTKAKPIIKKRVVTNVEKKNNNDDGETMWNRIKKVSGWPI